MYKQTPLCGVYGRTNGDSAYARYDSTKSLSSKMATLASALGPGRWYTCRKDHLYYVGGCGLPMETVECPVADCGAPIGGTMHRLCGDNAVAPVGAIEGLAVDIAPPRPTAAILEGWSVVHEQTTTAAVVRAAVPASPPP